MLGHANNSNVSNLISAIGSDDFDKQFFRYFDGEIGISQCTIFRFQGVESTQCIAAYGKNREETSVARRLASEYSSGLFNDDPNRNALMRTGRNRSIASVRHVSSFSIKNTNYRHKFYRMPRLSQKLIVDYGTGDTSYYVNFYRSNTQANFDDQALRRLYWHAPVIRSCIDRHLMFRHNDGELGELIERAPDEERAIRLQCFKQKLLEHSCRLSCREAEICAYIVMGYTTTAICLNLDITKNTVATHRKRAYAKLGISSQAELFGQLFELVDDLKRLGYTGDSFV